MKFIPFHTPMWQFDFDDDMSAMAEACLKIKEERESIKYSNINGYHSPAIGGDEFITLLPNIMSFVEKAMAEVEADLSMKFAVVEGWVNVNPKGGFNKLHNHPTVALSSVLYVKTNEDSGKIFFKNPTNSGLFPLDQGNPAFFGEYWMPSKQGSMLVFPAYLDHYVEPNMSDEDRISIAINFRQVNV
jgi:uncharacterized protein (TIGR02466 family)